MGICCSDDIDYNHESNCNTRYQPGYDPNNRYNSVLKDGYIVSQPAYNYCRYKGGVIKCCQDERCDSNNQNLYPQYQPPLNYNQPPYNPEY